MLRFFDNSLQGKALTWGKGPIAGGRRWPSPSICFSGEAGGTLLEMRAGRRSSIIPQTLLGSSYFHRASTIWHRARATVERNRDRVRPRSTRSRKQLER